MHGSVLGGNPSTNQAMPAAIWPGTMTVLAGIDLLGKFHIGNDDDGGVSGRFKAFVSRYFQSLNPEDETAIFQLRNALMHSFGLYSEKKKKPPTKPQIFRFTVIHSGGPLVTRVDDEKVFVDLATLHCKFEHAVKAYQSDLEKCSTLRRNFGVMFPKYGFTNICQSSPGMTGSS